MKRFVAGFVMGLLVLPLLFLLYLRSGHMPVATSEPPMPFEESLARSALAARIDKEKPGVAPLAADPAALNAGARIYRDNCAFCHGLPGHEVNAAAKGMFPQPPQLFAGKGVTDDPPGETYWKVANGIRLTGMPGFGKSLSTGEMWQVSLLLAHADQLAPETQAALKP